MRPATPFRKAVRDLQRERGRTLLVVLAIAVGIAGFGAVLSSYAVLTRELNLAYLALAIDWQMEGETPKAMAAVDRVWWAPHKEPGEPDEPLSGH